MYKRQSQKEQAVTADDITKEISDETFAVETSMEGIHYDAEKEDVTLVSIKDENGGEYHSDKSGTYIATYMVVPKDQSDSYTITRKVTLTDTEGQAHSEENGGEKQKSDTESEDDSDSPVQNYTDVELSLIHISEPTRQAEISYAVFCLKKKKKKNKKQKKKKNKKEK